MRRFRRWQRDLNSFLPNSRNISRQRIFCDISASLHPSSATGTVHCPREFQSFFFLVVAEPFFPRLLRRRNPTESYTKEALFDGTNALPLGAFRERKQVRGACRPDSARRYKLGTYSYFFVTLSKSGTYKEIVRVRVPAHF